MIGEGGEKSAETEKDSVERKLSIYMAKVMEQPVAVSNDVDIADFLQYRLREKYPVGDRGGLTDLDRVVEEIREYYDSLPDFPKDMKALLKRIQHKIAFPHMEICMPGMFLGVAPEEIADIRLPAEERTEAYDAEILRLYKDGLSFAEISRKTGAEPWRVNDICKDRYGHRGEKSSRRRYQKMDRAELDRKYYPQVCEIIREIEYNDGGCPGRVTLNGVAARLGIRNRLLSELPECIEEIERCACTVEENRAKKLLWAGRKAIENGQILNKQRIMEYVCLDRKAVVSALPYLEKYADGEVCRQVKELVGSEEP